MSKRLTGLNPLAYIGVEPLQPPNMILSKNAPTTSDSRNVNLGDFWMDTTTETLYVLVSLAAGIATWVTTFGGATTTFITDSGTATESGGAIHIVGDGLNIATSGAGSTVTIRENPDPTFGNVTITGTLDITSFTEGVLVSDNSGNITSSPTTNHSILIGNSTGTISSLGVATNGEIPIGSTGADPVLATITGGTGITVTNGAGSITISTTGGAPIDTIDGDTGSATGSTITIETNVAAHGCGTAEFSASGSTVTLLSADGNGNVGWGPTAMANITSGNSNAAFGDAAGNGITTGTNNALCGSAAGFSLTTGSNNSAVGQDAMSLLTTGSSNCVLGNFALSQLHTGGDNIAIGQNAGENITGAESNNIYLNNLGILGESNVLRIGRGTGSGSQQLAETFISGIQGVNAGAVSSVVSINGDQLGTTTLTAGTGISITPGAGSITIAATGGGGGGGGSLTFIQSQTASSATSLAFTTGITTGFDNYILIGDSIEATQTGTSFSMQIQISTNGGSSYITSGYISQSGTPSPTTGLNIGQYLTTNSGGTGVNSLTATLYDLTAGGAANFPATTSEFMPWDGSTGVSGAAITAVYPTASTTVNAFQIVLSNGGTFSGKFTLYGYSPTGGGSGGLLTTKTTLTSTQIKNLVGTPITVIPAAGANQLIIVRNVDASFTYGGSNAFTNPQSILLYYETNTTGFNAGGQVLNATFLVGTSNAIMLNEASNSSGGTITPTNQINQPIVVGVDSGSSNITGNAANDNSITFVTTYEIVDVTTYF